MPFSDETEEPKLWNCAQLKLKPKVKNRKYEWCWLLFSDETEEPKEDAEGGQALLKKEDQVAGTVGELIFLYFPQE